MADNWNQHKERSNPLALRMICRFAQYMPRNITRLWLWPITLYFFLFAPGTRRASRDYLRRIPGKNGTWLEIFAHMHCFASMILDRVYFLTDRFDKFDIRIEGTELLDEAIVKKQGAILLGAHIGSFEVMRCLAIRHSSMPLKIMMYLDHNAMITRILDELNPQVAKSVINLSEPNALLQAKEAIEEGGFIGMLGDRVLPGEKTVSARLLDSRISLPVGPIAIASMLGVPVYIFFGIYLGGNCYRIKVEKLGEGNRLARKERSEMVEALTGKYARKMETMLKQYPYNWFNFYNYWSEGA